jgi:DNA invertase Pin-like site-specific DNA recombinase
MNTKIFGYVRVSSKDQNIERQILELRKLDIDERDIYIDKQSGKDFDRREYLRLKSNLRSGDILVVKSLDRFGRNYQMIKQEWEDITSNIKAHINIVDMPILNTNQSNGKIGLVITDIVLSLLSYVAEQERDFINQRQKEGIKIAKGKGVRFGRPQISMPKDFDTYYKLWKDKKIKAVDVMKKLNLKTNTFYKMVHVFEKNYSIINKQ